MCCFWPYNVWPHGFWRSWVGFCYSFETPSLHFYGNANSSELPKPLVAGRPSPTLRGGHDLADFRGLCSDKSRTRAINCISKCCKFTSKYDDRDFMAITAIAVLLVSREVEKRWFSQKIDLWPVITGSDIDNRRKMKKIGHQARVLVEPSPLAFVTKCSVA